MRRILRYEVPVDDQPHNFKLDGPPHHVAARDARTVEFWAIADDNPAIPPCEAAFQVVGTGQPLPAGCLWTGTTARTPEGLVWHLIEVAPETR